MQRGRASRSIAALLARQGDAPRMGRFQSVLDWILHTLLQRARRRIAASAQLLKDPPAPPQPLPWEAEAAEADRQDAAALREQAAAAEAYDEASEGSQPEPRPA